MFEKIVVHPVCEHNIACAKNMVVSYGLVQYRRIYIHAGRFAFGKQQRTAVGAEQHRVRPLIHTAYLHRMLLHYESGGSSLLRAYPAYRMPAHPLFGRASQPAAAQVVPYEKFALALRHAERVLGKIEAGKVHLSFFKWDSRAKCVSLSQIFQDNLPYKDIKRYRMSSNSKNRREEALRYHAEGRPGKIEVVPTKPYSSQRDLSLAYSPGVAEPCLEIEKNPEDAYLYTAKGNLVAVISNGTAVLGLGNIGAQAGKPVMEGKGLLFKTFADIDVFDIEVDATDTEAFIQTVKNISPTFGGINLEDIKAPECFEIEERLKAELNIPVMHDDQHGTAIISAAAMLNALEIVGKNIGEIKVVVNGAGAAAISCSKLYIALGVRRENIVMCDSKGVISTSRTDLNKTKREFATERQLAGVEEALAGADLFLGLSVADTLTQDMVRSMAADPIVFALANPNPEISYEEAMASRPDIVYATGRSDYPNQVNNVLGFPYIFRGALDVRATTINEQMKVAAVRALAALTKEPVPDIVKAAYNGERITFGREYLIPKPVDPRLITHVASAVAKAAIESGVARKTIDDWDAYRFELEGRMGRGDKLLRALRTKAVNAPRRRIVLSEGTKLRWIQAAAHLVADHLAYPILIGGKKRIHELAQANNVDLAGIEIVDFRSDELAQQRERYAAMLHTRLGRNGMSLTEARKYAMQRNWFVPMMVAAGDADAALLGYSRRYTRDLIPVSDIFTASKQQTLASMVIVSTRKGPIFFADMAVNPSPSAEQLVDIARMAASTVRRFGKEPVIAMLSHSNFGTDTEREALTVARAVQMLHDQYPDILVDGEMKADIALDAAVRAENYPFNKLGGREVNTFIFPNLSAANISYKMVERLGGAEITGPILMGLQAGVHLIAETSSIRSLVNLATVALANQADINQ